jgi:hypothetical protein
MLPPVGQRGFWRLERVRWLGPARVKPTSGFRAGFRERSRLSRSTLLFRGVSRLAAACTGPVPAGPRIFPESPRGMLRFLDFFRQPFHYFQNRRGTFSLAVRCPLEMGLSATGGDVPRAMVFADSPPIGSSGTPME